MSIVYVGSRGVQKFIHKIQSGHLIGSNVFHALELLDRNFLIGVNFGQFTFPDIVHWHLL